MLSRILKIVPIVKRKKFRSPVFDNEVFSLSYFYTLVNLENNIKEIILLVIAAHLLFKL